MSEKRHRNVNFSNVLPILMAHAAEIGDKTGILSVNGIIVDAVIDRIRECATLTEAERLTLLMWSSKHGATIALPAGGRS